MDRQEGKTERVSNGTRAQTVRETPRVTSIDRTCGVLTFTTTWKPRSSHPRSETHATSQEESKVNLQAQVSLSLPLVQPPPKTGGIHLMGLRRRRLLGRYWIIVELPCSSRGCVGKRYTARRTLEVARATQSYGRQLELDALNQIASKVESDQTNRNSCCMDPLGCCAYLSRDRDQRV